MVHLRIFGALLAWFVNYNKYAYICIIIDNLKFIFIFYLNNYIINNTHKIDNIAGRFWGLYMILSFLTRNQFKFIIKTNFCHLYKVIYLFVMENGS